ncbi:MAG: 50S ribosomal protein L28 [Chloroflexi bacterium]|nr:50S ribosomal protein L28 [Chloroflexota bacterium]
MPGRCEVCGKTRVFGNNVSHSKRHTRRTWQPNTHRTVLSVKGDRVRVNICTRCLRTYHKSRA